MPRNRHTPLATKIAQTILIVKQKIAMGIAGSPKHKQRKTIATVSKATMGPVLSILMSVSMRLAISFGTSVLVTRAASLLAPFWAVSSLAAFLSTILPFHTSTVSRTSMQLSAMLSMSSLAIVVVPFEFVW